jgi:hypothetical protein
LRPYLDRSLLLGRLEAEKATPIANTRRRERLITFASVLFVVLPEVARIHLSKFHCAFLGTPVR